MNKKTLILIGIIITFLIISVSVYILKPVTKRTVGVTGECTTMVPKDNVAITLRITTLDKNSAVSMNQASQKLAEMMEFFKTQDVQVETTGFNSYEKTDWDNKSQKQISVGIETNISVEVFAKNRAIIESVLDKFAGSKNIYSDNLRIFTSKQASQKATESCLDLAIKNARERAEVIAKSENKSIGKMISAQYLQNYTSEDFENIQFSARASKTDSVPIQLSNRDSEITVNVNAVFEIK